MILWYSVSIPFFHFETQRQADDIHDTILKQSPRPVVTAPCTLPAGQVVVVAYDGARSDSCRANVPGCLVGQLT